MRRPTRYLAVALLVAACGGGTPSRPTAIEPGTTVPPGPVVPPTPVPSGPQILVGAGDIGQCDGSAEATAKLLDGIGGTVFTAGDNAYFHGSREDFAKCYDPTWGRHKARTRPAPGNHEYESPGAAPYFEYFGANAGPFGVGYYSFEVGAWHILSLNSNVDSGASSLQASWVRDDLATHPSRCTLAIWHHPLFSSGPNGDTASMRAMWRILYDAGVEIVVNGHDHLYERFAPQTPDGLGDPVRGIRQFTAGTGGASLYQPGAARPNSEARVSGQGVLKFTLSTDRFDWEFIGVSGARDIGSGTCH